jgi:alpha-tubulin suppressor-like RCC1 family protein
MDSQKAGLYSWGLNNYGQLGDGTTANIAFTKHIFEEKGICINSVSAGLSFSLAVTDNGQVFAWGYNENGQLGDGTTANRYVPVSVVSGSKIRMVSAGRHHSLAVTEDGDVLAWGCNEHGRLGDGTMANRYLPISVTSGIGSKVKTVSAGGHHSLTVTENGEVFSWGYNAYGQRGDGTTTDKPDPLQIRDFSFLKLKIVAVAAGGNHSMALTDKGQVWVWGYNGCGQLGDGTTTNYHRPVVVRGLEGVIAIAAGDNHCLALLDDGRVFGWGDNRKSQITEPGYGSTVKTPMAIAVLDAKSICAIFSGSSSDHNFALSSTGTVWSWGNNSHGQASDRDIAAGTLVNAPNQVEGLEGIGFAAAGDYHSLVTSMNRSATVQLLNAKTEWMPMDVHVKSGETLIIDAKGQWKVASNPDTYFITANGFDGFSLEGTVLATANLGSLVGRIGLNGRPFFVGSHFDLKCQESGRLYLQMNDFPGTGMADNEGQLEISMKKVS